MTNHQNPERDLTQTQETVRAIVTQSEQLGLLESIENLRGRLGRLIPLLNSESIETATRSTLALERMHREIDQILATLHLLESQDRLQRWENEGGWSGYVSE